MTELEHIVPAELLNPMTGELVNVHDLPRLAEVIEALREHRQQVNDTMAAFTEAVAAESRRQGTRTLAAGDWVLELSADSAIEWDVPALFALENAGLPRERMNELVRSEITYKVDGRVARQLAGASPAYKAIIEAATVRVPRRQYVTVKGAK